MEFWISQLYYYVTDDSELTAPNQYGSLYQGNKVVKYPFPLKRCWYAGVGMAQFVTILNFNTESVSVRLFDAFKRPTSNNDVDFCFQVVGTWK